MLGLKINLLWFQNQAIKRVFLSKSNDQSGILQIKHFDPGRRRFYKVNRSNYPSGEFGLWE